MRCKAQHSLWLAATLAPLLILGAGSVDDMKEANDGLDMYFRDGDLLALTDQPLPIYPDTTAGESVMLERDFPDAPPQIPHTTEDMYPITLDENECLDCHHPENTVSKDDLPLPESHFKAPVMGKGAPGDPMIWVVKDYKIKDIVGGRYNCNMCHTPQASNVKTPNNSFISARKAKKTKKKTK
jgi:cytochrome c-type protein NapB